jgi:hypothetical protein
MLNTIFLECWTWLCNITDFFSGDGLHVAVFIFSVYVKIFMCMMKFFEKTVSYCFRLPDPVFNSITNFCQNDHNIISAYNSEGPITNKFFTFCKLFYDVSGEIQGIDFAKYKKIFGSTELFCRFLHENKIISADFYEKMGILYVNIDDEEYEAVFGKICFLWNEIKKHKNSHKMESMNKDDIELEELMQKINRGEF